MKEKLSQTNGLKSQVPVNSQFTLAVLASSNPAWQANQLIEEAEIVQMKLLLQEPIQDSSNSRN